MSFFPLQALLQAAGRRKTLFTKAKVPRLTELVDARVTMIHPLQIGDYGFVLTANGVMCAQGKIHVHSIDPNLIEIFMIWQL